MAFAPSVSWNSPSITHLANCPSRSLPTNSSDESEFWVWLKRVMLPARDLTRQRLDFKTRNGYFTEFLTISRCGAEERRCSARRVSRDSHSTNWGFGAHQCPCMATRASAPSHHRRKVFCDLIAIGRSEFVITGKPE